MNPHGNVKHGGHGTLTYSRWKSMQQRCKDSNADNYARYGGRGIGVCEAWNSFAAFLADMGECPNADMTLERLNNEIDYQPGNCKWISQAEQNRNRSSCIKLTHNGITQNATDWAKAIGITPNTLFMRLRLGWSVERALTQPLKVHGDITKIYRKKGTPS